MYFQDLRDDILLVNFENRIDPQVNQEVRELYHFLLENKNQFYIHSITPAYCSIAVGFEKTKISQSQIINFINNYILERTLTTTCEDVIVQRFIKIPVCYDLNFALDAVELEHTLGLSLEEIIFLHSNQMYQVYMIGFLPGFPFMGRTPSALHCRRKAQPRIKVPARSIGLAGQQTGIYPIDSPGGWNIIGRTPLDIFRSSSQEDPFWISMGDRVSFVPINLKEYEAIAHKELAFDPIAKS